MATDPRTGFRALGAATRRRRRRRVTWTVAAAIAALAFGALVWEALAGPALPLRWAGYGALAMAGVGVAALAVLRWFEPAPSELAVAERLERLYPQARGRARESLRECGTGLEAARVERARAWLARRGRERLEVALGAEHDVAVVRLRRATATLALLAGLAAAVQPVAARRVISALVDPTGLWAGAGTWRVEPGDAVARIGESVEGRAVFRGPEAGGVLVLEWRTLDGAWTADILASGPAGRWRWEDVGTTRRYRLRYGPYRSPEYRLEVEAPLALIELTARRPGGSWRAWSGYEGHAGDPIEVRGVATEPVVSAVVRLGRTGDVDLDVDGPEFGGTFTPAAGEAVVIVRTADGREAGSAAIEIVPAAGAFVSVLRPIDDPAILGASRAWIEVRATAPDGLREIRWERDDGRSGTVAPGAGARDTTVTALVGLGEGRSPGDTVLYRAVAVPDEGPLARSPWRRAVLPAAATLRAGAREERRAAARAVERAVSEAQRAAEEARAEAGVGAEPFDEAGAEVDRRLGSAADSLSSALERTLADPDLPEAVRERLEAYRRLLEGLDEVTSEPATPWTRPDAAAETGARAELLEEIAARIAEVESMIERAGAADDLDRLAEAERELAQETIGASPDELEETIGPRQESLEAEARQALERAEGNPGFSQEASEALQRAGEAVEGGDPAAAAVAQEEAAEALAGAASEARERVEQQAGLAAERRAAIERAGVEALFLAERQSELVTRLVRPPDGAAEHQDRVARQRVVTQGLERALGSLVEAVGGLPVAGGIPELLARAVYETKRAEREVGRAGQPRDSGMRSAVGGGGAAASAADALARLARALLRPPGDGAGGSGAGAAGATGAVAEGLRQLAEAQAAVADAAGAAGTESEGGNPDAAASQRGVAEGLGEVAEEAEEAGLDRRAMDALAREAEEAAARLERGLSGARTESELRSLSRRMADLGRTIERESPERRKSETARPFVPAEPGPLPARATAPELDPDAAMAGWEAILPGHAVEPGRRYLERLSGDGVREPVEAP